MFRKFLFLWLISLTCLTVSAEDLNNLDNVNNEANINSNVEVKVYLDTIKLNKSIKQENKVYLQITEYSNLTQAKEHRIPTYPKHWLQRDLLKLKNIILWKGVVESLETKRLIISLVDNEFISLRGDESLGSVKLILDNQNQEQKINIVWEKAGFKEPVQIKKIIDQKQPNHVAFTMHGKHSDYLVRFYVKTKLQK